MGFWGEGRGSGVDELESLGSLKKDGVILGPKSSTLEGTSLTTFLGSKAQVEGKSWRKNRCHQ